MSMNYSIHEVRTAADVRAFLDVPLHIYKSDPNWVCPLESEIEEIFDPQKNGQLKTGSATRWILKDQQGKLCGRVGAFVSQKYSTQYDYPMGGLGYFECVNDQQAANLLFDTAKAWLVSKGMEGMDGPINFGGNDKFWGLLVEGFTHPSYGMNYHSPYYTQLFENYGFRTYFEQVSRHLDITEPIPERFMKIATWVASKPGVKFEHASRKQLVKYARDFVDIHNDAWKYHEHFTQLNEEHAHKMAEALKHVLIEQFMIFAYVKDEPAGFLFCLPDLNQIFKPFNGKFPLWKKLLFKWRSRNDFAWYRKKGILTRGRVIVIGVKPKFQKYGIESGLTMFSMEDARKMGFHEIELSWVGDFNPMSRKLQDATNAKPGKIHRTYRLLFDPTIQWERSQTLKADPRLEGVGEAE
ncbi:MAG: GNAT family N-acetyltransferase [Bacteroidia bacterium]|nr:GNAT family N-acetyltransferase [Bacteroidia bacterium]